MKVIIAGSRTFADTDKMAEELKQFQDAYGKIEEVICGGASGADHLGRAWAIANGVKVKVLFAHWKEHGKSAGMIRNGEMADRADRAIVFWDGVSMGTRNMIEQMRKRGKRCDVVMFGKK